MRGRAWLQPPPPSRVYLDGHLPCHTPLVAMGARVWELLEVIDKGLCLSKLVSPSRRRKWEAEVPVSHVLVCAGR